MPVTPVTAAAAGTWRLGDLTVNRMGLGAMRLSQQLCRLGTIAGHADDAGWHDAGMRGLTGWWGVVLEAPDGPALARFYSSLLGWPVAAEDEHGAAIGPAGTSYYLSFDSSPAYEPPVWPAEPGRQRQMMHIDIAVDDLAATVADAIALGAMLAEFQPQDDVRVLLDPAGHPFCLYLDHH